MEVSGSTRVCAVIGDPVHHSLSPCIHNAAFQHLGLDYVYVAFQVGLGELGTAIRGARSLNIHGLNVTMPLKVEIIRYLNRLDGSAEAVGAVNTVLNKDGALVGYDTDGRGALMALEAGKGSLAKEKIVILGAGGASRAISHTLAGEAREVVILNRTLEKAERLVKELSKRFGEKVKCGKLCRKDIEEELRDADTLINATSLGMSPHKERTPVEKDLLRPDLRVFDLVYNPLETRLLKEAKSIGAETIDGLTMLVSQGAASFEIWTGRRAPIEVMMKVAREKLSEA